MKKLLCMAALAVAIQTAATAGNTNLQAVADPAPILRDLQQKMSSVTTVYLEFKQERVLKLFADPLRSEGVMLIERPELIRWETTAPFQSILLANHQSVAQFERADGQWKKLKLGFPEMLKRVMGQMSEMNQGKMDAMTADYTVSVATGSLAVLTLVPKDKTIRSMLSSLEVKMEPDYSATREVVMNEPGGDYTRIIFKNERRGVKFPPGTFDQSSPKNIAEVVSAVKSAP